MSALDSSVNFHSTKQPEASSRSHVIAGCLMCSLIILASLDLWNQFMEYSRNMWFHDYRDAALAGDTFWQLAYRTENLELKIDAQKSRLHEVRTKLNNLLPRMKIDMENLRGNTHDFKHTRAARISMHELLTNDSEIYRITCGTDSEAPILRVGLNDFRTDVRDSCDLYSPERILPNAFFEKVSLGEGAFGLKPLSGGGNFLQVVPPANALEFDRGPWKVVLGGPVAGQQERFRLNGDYIYSSAMEGYLRCGQNQQVTGEPSLSPYRASRFSLERVGDKDVRYAQEVASLSEQILSIQEKYSSENRASVQAQKAAVHSSTHDSTTPIRICIGVPITSKGTDMTSVRDSPLWSNLFDSFMKSIDWRSNRFVFGFYLGFDRGDPFYDTGDSWTELREIFINRARYRLEETLLEKEKVEEVLKNQLLIKLSHYEDKFDYFYQVNDDTVIETPNWPSAMVGALAGNPFLPNFGVTGPLDTNNDKIFTHSFVHRTHIEVFGFLFPASFKNWWSDDWISTVYGASHTFRLADVKINHNVNAQKTEGRVQRYEVDHGAQLRLDNELRKGFTQIDSWLKKNEHPRLSLPAVCGFIPGARYLYKMMKHSTYNDHHKSSEL
eukprot:GSChrysophyteH1.ASY1.ANO1.3181.1 assembled CDS